MAKLLTDFQLVILTSALLRDDRCLVPPPKLRGRPLKACEEKLIAAGMVREVHAKGTTPIWRTDPSGQNYSLKLTTKGEKAGVEAPAVGGSDGKGEESSDTKIEGAADGNVGKETKQSEVDGFTSAIQPLVPNSHKTPRRAPRPAGAEQSNVRSQLRANSKLAHLVGLLSRDCGATLVELTTATGWLPHTTRAALTRLRQRGFELERLRNEAGGASIFRIQSDRHGVQERTDESLVR